MTQELTVNLDKEPDIPPRLLNRFMVAQGELTNVLMKVASKFVLADAELLTDSEAQWKSPSLVQIV
eukprot:CAMPEP_0184316730 /NCGR_PEP_ID=MMETSP1049-20130417/92126_1 /TAXON_ID=77928 /ORGANISM="Proteomonas sulcata, Strain CCMP704" /LENGTH=65 /DNA_ID=CAMNT_0026635841 /DNA_START=1334 /DNA_END=1531 /DNA_ORIENTATION=+